METMTSVLGFGLAVCLALVHIFASKARWLLHLPQRWWMSFAGGISITYIFLDIFPELSHAQAEASPLEGIPLIRYVENHVYLLALVGLAVFYGLEQMALRSRRHNAATKGDQSTEAGVFWVHTAFFALYNAVLGYLLTETGHSSILTCLLLFFVLGLHFVVNDIGLREHHQRSYDKLGRWLLAGAILVGWSLAQAVTFSEMAFAVAWALVSGAMILNVLKEELPEQEDSHFGLFVTGIALYAVVLLASQA